MLEVEASNLVRELTDGRYERMEFDDNFRVKLLDRFDDSYAIERFSGGEADVASLSARVALSRIVASRGGNTLGFLVLDEVWMLEEDEAGKSTVRRVDTSLPPDSQIPEALTDTAHSLS
jgi:uncharacterized protein YhaN